MTLRDATPTAGEAELPSRRRVLQRAALTSGAAVAGEQTNAESSTVVFADGSGQAAYTHGGLVLTDTAFDAVSDDSYEFAAVAGVATSQQTSGLRTARRVEVLD